MTKTESNFPETLKVGPFTVTLEENADTLDQLGGDAAWHGAGLRILYDTRQAPGFLRDSVLHETLHALYQQTGLYKATDAEKDAEEQFVASMTPRLLALLRDNPVFVAWLMEDL